MDLNVTINAFYYDMALDELRRMNGSRAFPGISHNTVLYLDLIAMTPDCTASRLAEMLRVSKSAVTVKLGELIAKGLVKKRPHPTDGRVFYLEATPAVKRELRAYDKTVGAALATLRKTFSAEELASFGQVLDAFRRAYMDEAARQAGEA